ncbi:hypothetical protein YC2023_039226 [Brassica napus]
MTKRKTYEQKEREDKNPPRIDKTQLCQLEKTCVILVAIEGRSEGELVVAGDGVDAACLVDASTITIPQHCCLARCSTICYEQPQPETYELVYNSYGSTTGCTIM